MKQELKKLRAKVAALLLTLEDLATSQNLQNDVRQLRRELIELKEKLSEKNLAANAATGQYAVLDSALQSLEQRAKVLFGRSVTATAQPQPVVPPVVVPPAPIVPPVLPPANPVVVPANATATTPAPRPPCAFWVWICNYWPQVLIAVLTVLVVGWLVSNRQTSEDANSAEVITIGFCNRVKVCQETFVTNITVIAGPSEYEIAHEAEMAKELRDSVRDADRWQRNMWLLDEKRRQEQAEQAQPAATTTVNVYVAQSAPAPANIINQTIVQNTDGGCGYNEARYPRPVYPDQARRDYNIGVSAQLNCGVEVGFGGGNYYPPVTHFVQVQRGGCFQPRRCR